MSQRRSRGVLKVDRDDATAALSRAKLMKKGLEDHAVLFSSPIPSLPVFSDQIATTDLAHVLVGQRGKGMAAARDVQLGLLMGMMASELVYIQSVADTGNPDEAVSTLLAGGVVVAAFTGHEKAILAVTRGATSGEVVLTANAGALLGGKRHRKHFFSWGYTTDGGQTFLAMPPTAEATTKLSGLTLHTTVGFRVAVTQTKGTTSAWSPVVSFLIQ
jgi:hypothetical protein